MSTLYLAPMEGITGYLYRNAFAEYFGGISKYFTPFITPHTDRSFNSREKSDILPEHNQGMQVVPQILTNRADDFIRVAKDLQTFGYREVNLNLGCPSGTVVSRGRGAGFLSRPKELRDFLEQIFASLQELQISIKTRIGMEQQAEWEALLSIFNEFPVSELIVHPRVREDYYKNKPCRASFQKAMEESKSPVCYNGDIFTSKDHETLTEQFPELDRVMLGRGAIANPGLALQILSGESLSREKLAAFHDRLLSDYLTLQMGDKNTLFKMKELWYYMGALFPEAGKELKKIRKAVRVSDYRAAAAQLFREHEPRTETGFCPP